MRKANEFREFETIEILLYHQRFKLPTQKQTKDSADEANLFDEHDCIVNTEHIERRVKNHDPKIRFQMLFAYRLFCVIQSNSRRSPMASRSRFRTDASRRFDGDRWRYWAWIRNRPRRNLAIDGDRHSRRQNFVLDCNRRVDDASRLDGPSGEGNREGMWDTFR